MVKSPVPIRKSISFGIVIPDVADAVNLMLPLAEGATPCVTGGFGGLPYE
jgi:hypothetical protein